MKNKRYIKVDDKITLEVIINQDKTISFSKDCWAVEGYIEGLKTSIKAPDNFWDNYKFFLSFGLEDDKFIIKDDYLKHKFSIQFPEEILNQVKNYFQENKNYILKFIAQVKDKSETFFFYDDLLTSALWLPLSSERIDLFIPSIVHILNEISKKKKDNIVFDYTKVCNLFYCISDYKEVYEKMKNKTNDGEKIDIYDLYDYFKQVC